MERHIKIFSSYSAKIKKRQNDKVFTVCKKEFLKKFNRDRHSKTMHSQFEASEKHFNKTNKDVTINENLTLIRLGFLRVVFSGGRGSI